MQISRPGWLHMPPEGWRGLLRPGPTTGLLLLIGVPVIVALALLPGPPQDIPRRLGEAVTSGPRAALRSEEPRASETASSPPASPPTTHAPDDVVAVLDGEELTVREVREIVRADPEKAEELIFTDEVTVREATALLGERPTEEQLPEPAPELEVAVGPGRRTDERAEGPTSTTPAPGRPTEPGSTTTTTPPTTTDPPTTTAPPPTVTQPPPPAVTVPPPPPVTEPPPPPVTEPPPPSVTEPPPPPVTEPPPPPVTEPPPPDTEPPPPPGPIGEIIDGIVDLL